MKPSAILTATACAICCSFPVHPFTPPAKIPASAATALKMSQDPTLNSEQPAQLGPKRSFLGVRRESGILRRLMEQQRQQSQLQGRESTALKSSPYALMPDGGLSPCVIKVLGVGGGGSNAVRFKGASWICWRCRCPTRHVAAFSFVRTD